MDLLITLNATSDNLEGSFRYEIKEQGYSLIEWTELTVNFHQDRIMALVKKGANKEIFFRWKKQSEDGQWE
jgi:hypothetical protein